MPWVQVPSWTNFYFIMLKNYIFNRPISPHLSIYLPQFSSLFSIWHRISGLTLTMVLFTSILILETLLNSNFNFFVINFSFLHYWNIEFIYLLFIFLFSYHSLNGFRHIIWDLILFLKLKSLKLSSIFLLLLVLTIVVKTTTLF